MPFDPPFSGYIQPPGVPPDPTGNCWRGPPGPQGPPGPAADILNSPVTATGSTEPRMIPDRFADWVNVMDFGATLDGVAFDNAAYNAARTAVGTNGSVYVPYGQQRLNIAPTGGPATQVLWHLDGTYIGTAGANPVLGIGTDVVENFFGGNKYFGRSNSFAAVGPVLRVDSTVNHAGGTAGAVISTLRVNTTTSSTAVETCFGISSVVTDSRAVGNAMALAAYTVRNTARPNNLSYGLNTFVTDTTGLASSAAGAACGAEIDIIANGLDSGGLAGPMGVPAGAGIRTVLQAVGDAYDDGLADCEIGWGVRVTPSQGKSNVTFKRMYSAMGRFSKAAFSTEFATPDSANAHAILLADGHRIAFDTAGTRTLSYDTASGKLFFAVSGVNRFSIDASGNMRCAGTVTGSVTP
jgi:hypothetical protein